MELLKNNQEGREKMLNYLKQHENDGIDMEHNSNGEHFIVENNKRVYQLSDKFFNALVEKEIIIKVD